MIMIILTSLSLCGFEKGNSFLPSTGVRIENLEATVRFLTSISPARSFSNPDSMKRAADYISQKFQEYGLEPSQQEFMAAGRRYVNIIASAGPREGNRVIVGAHYDVCGNQPGADDNASGVAGLLDIARFAKEHESALRYRIDFVAYALEEPPFFGTTQMGSYAHAESLYKNNVRVKGMICLEMIGFFTDAKKSQSYPLSILRLFYPTTGNFISVVGNFGSSSLANNMARHLKATTVGVSKLQAPSFLTGVDFSDHRNYWKFGYEAVMVTDTAFYRNANYHEKTDTISTLDFKRCSKWSKGCAGASWIWSNCPNFRAAFVRLSGEDGNLVSPRLFGGIKRHIGKSDYRIDVIGSHTAFSHSHAY